MSKLNKRKFRVQFEVNEGLILDFWAKDEEDAYEVAFQAEVEGLITHCPMWEVLEVNEIVDEADRFNPINDQ